MIKKHCCDLHAFDFILIIVFFQACSFNICNDKLLQIYLIRFVQGKLWFYAWIFTIRFLINSYGNLLSINRQEKEYFNRKIVSLSIIIIILS
jgi:hypothetical protein